MEPSASDILDGAAWRALTERLQQAGSVVWDREGLSELQRAEGMRYLLRFISAGIRVCIEHDDTDAPELGRMIEPHLTWGLDNPDCLYLYSRVDGRASYRLSGNIGSARHLEVQVNSGHYSDGDFTGWQAVSALAGDDIETDADGSFEIVLSIDATGRNGMALDARASFLLVRQYFDDWETERPAALFIERLAGPAPSSPIDAETMAVRVGLLLDWLDIGLHCWDDLGAGLAAGEPGDITPFLPPAEASGLKGQAYGMGGFRARDDEAVVLSFTPPTCRMWGLSLCDRFWQSIDFTNHTSSLNGAQAVPNPDGQVVAVISQRDPGVANWLDPAGHHEGTLAVRYLLPADVPTVSYRAVAFDDLERVLPDETPRIDTAQRTDLVRRRRRALAHRYRR